MHALFFLIRFLILPCFLLVRSQTIQPNIPLGSSINSGTSESWSSPSGRFAFGFYPIFQGFAIGVWLQTSPEKTIIWTDNQDEPQLSGGSIRLSFDGRLSWSAPGGQGKDISNPPEPAVGAAMLNSGNFVLLNSAHRVVWSTFATPTNTIVPGQTLQPNSQLISSLSENNPSTGKFRLTNQNDGNLVLYPVHTTNTADDAYWDSGTFQIGFLLTLNLADNGVLFLSGNNSAFTKNLTQSTTSQKPSVEIYYRAVIDVDGVLRVYHHSLTKNGSWETGIEWAALTDKCLVRGVCGLNSYCTSLLVDGVNAGEQTCLCPPGFGFVDSNQRTLGCTRSYTGGDCMNGSEITMVVMKNTTWVDKTYSTLTSTNMDDCEAACLNDCFCMAALFRKNGECSKQLLPLRYGRVGGNDTLFIKVGVMPNSSSGEQHRRSRKGTSLLVMTVVFAALLLVVLLGFLFIVIRGRRRHHPYVKNYHSSLDEEAPLKAYSYEELENATNGFTEELGRGAFGVVFKGELSKDGKDAIAVKKLQKVVEEGEKEFQREVKAIARTHHRNLVQLLGFCNEGSHRLLVYQFMSNGSLADLIFKRDQNRPDWKERLRIALDVARGIHYLHEDCATHIIHCDIKPQNILMDNNWTARISDFGLAKLLMHSQTKTFTGIRGTRGYLAPEWYKNMPITVKTDVYSFGIVLLEILCCKSNLEPQVDADEIILSDWVYSCYLAGELEKLTLDEDVNMVEFENAVKVGLWCIQTDPILRPSMKKVIIMLEGYAEISPPPNP